MHGLEDLEAALEELEDAAPQIMRASMDSALRYLHQELPEYPDWHAGELPAVYDRQPQKRKFTSKKQRRFFFVALREGRIKPHTGAYKSKFKTAKQQAYFFWAVNSGKIQIPYRRTGTLQREITTETAVNGNAVIGNIGTALEYAPYVIGDNQAPIHQGRWWQLDDEVEKNLDDATRVLEETAWAEIEKLWAD